MVSHSQWPSILTNRPHFGQIVRGSSNASESSVWLAYIVADITIVDHYSLYNIFIHNSIFSILCLCFESFCNVYRLNCHYFSIIYITIWSNFSFQNRLCILFKKGKVNHEQDVYQHVKRDDGYLQQNSITISQPACFLFFCNSSYHLLLSHSLLNQLNTKEWKANQKHRRTSRIYSKTAEGCIKNLSC